VRREQAEEKSDGQSGKKGGGAGGFRFRTRFGRAGKAIAPAETGSTEGNEGAGETAADGNKRSEVTQEGGASRAGSAGVDVGAKSEAD